MDSSGLHPKYVFRVRIRVYIYVQKKSEFEIFDGIAGMFFSTFLETFTLKKGGV